MRPDSSDSDVGDHHELTPGHKFVDYMPGLLMHNTLSARQLGTAMWWAQKAKACAFRPDAPSGHYNRKVKAAFGWDDTSCFYPADVPGHRNHDL